VLVNPTVTTAGFEVQEVIPAVPLTDQETVPVGATDPFTPVTTTVNTRVELSTPVPVPLRTIDAGAALEIVTGVAATALSAV
jgi:hypothetical protein